MTALFRFFFRLFPFSEEFFIPIDSQQRSFIFSVLLIVFSFRDC